jgi:hypothetical protein
VHGCRPQVMKPVNAFLLESANRVLKQAGMQTRKAVAGESCDDGIQQCSARAGSDPAESGMGLVSSSCRDLRGVPMGPGVSEDRERQFESSRPFPAAVEDAVTEALFDQIAIAGFEQVD